MFNNLVNSLAVPPLLFLYRPLVLVAGKVELLVFIDFLICQRLSP
eukprot:XP_001704434.1 Hypothetical protein GL50803_31527 [Giardia lamblia ATCC 50803]